MDNILDLYSRKYDPKRPVICLDEKSKQLLEDSRPTLPVRPGKTAIQDYEYVRNGTRNIFVAVEPKGGYRVTQVTNYRKRHDYALFIERLEKEYPHAEQIDIVQDNLNTHFIKSLTEAFGKEKSDKLMLKINFHYTPKHASWLNMAEIEIGVMERQCFNRRIPTGEKLEHEVKAWTKSRNENHSHIKWKFTHKKARETFPELYTDILRTNH